MRGVCIDLLNRPPSEKTLKKLGVTGYRAEIRAGVDYRQWSGLQSCLLIGPSTEPGALEQVNVVPDVVIIGNEPDGPGESSWSMDIQDYARFWNLKARHTRALWPKAKLSMAGLVGNSLDYLDQCWPLLTLKPDYVNRHYPNSKDDLEAFGAYADVIVGEWCWRIAKMNEMMTWETMLEQATRHSFWFCWSDGMVPTMGLVSKDNDKHTAYWRYQAALACGESK